MRYSRLCSFSFLFVSCCFIFLSVSCNEWLKTSYTAYATIQYVSKEAYWKQQQEADIKGLHNNHLMSRTEDLVPEVGFIESNKVLNLVADRLESGESEHLVFGSDDVTRSERLQLLQDGRVVEKDLNTFQLRIGFTHKDPYAAVLVANLFGDAVIELHLEITRRNTLNGIEDLARIAAQQRELLVKVTQKIKEFEDKNGNEEHLTAREAELRKKLTELTQKTRLAPSDDIAESVRGVETALINLTKTQIEYHSLLREHEVQGDFQEAIVNRANEWRVLLSNEQAMRRMYILEYAKVPAGL